MKAFVLGILGSFATVFTTVKAFFIQTIRISKKQNACLFEAIKKEGKALVLEEELSEKPIPSIYKALVWFNFPIYIHSIERLLQAGYTGVDNITTVTIIRWHRHKLETILKKYDKVEDKLPIYVLTSYGAERISELALKNKVPPILYCEDNEYNDIETSILNVIDKKEDKVGVILHGAPGTGKSYFIRHIALKYKLPIYIASFEEKMDNLELIRMFSNIAGPCLVVFEDFDSYFNERKCLMTKHSFTFDTLLNLLDGLYSNTSNVIYILTVNDLTKVDGALKYRPSRFLHIKEFKLPSYEIRYNILKQLPGVNGNAHSLAAATEEFSLDQVLALVKLVAQDIDFYEAVDLIKHEKQTCLEEQMHLALKEREEATQ